MIEFSAIRGPRLTLDPASVLDIGACIVNGENLAPGRAIPDDGDARIDHALEGFLFTCGPDHLRHPEPVDGDPGRTYPLHGAFSAHPATILSMTSDGGTAECRATVDVTMTGGGRARLERRWHIDAAGTVHLDDRIVNTGDSAFPPMLMYHMNVGARLFDGDVRLSGAMLDGGGFPWTFGADPGGVFCVPAAPDESGWAELVLGPMASVGGLRLTVGFRTETLPFLQIWRNQAAPANVLGIEPCSHRWAGRAELADAGELTCIAPGEGRDYGLRFSFA